MNVTDQIRRVAGAIIVTTLAGLGAAQAQSQTCTLSSQHVGLSFPATKVEARWTCPLQAVIGDYTTANKIGPIVTPLAEPVYRYLLDRPPMAAALINRLDLGLYKSEARGPGRFWGHDGEGTSGIVELVYQDHRHRIYYLEGSHKSSLLPHVTGKAVVFLTMNPTKDREGHDAVETTLAAYTKLDSRVLAGLVSLIRPLVGSAIVRKLNKGIDVVDRLGRAMRQHPDRVLFEATDPPPLPDEEVAFLKSILGERRAPGAAPTTGKPPL